MRFSCKRARLAEVAGLVGQAVSGKSTKKIFECIRLEAREAGLEFSGTDLEVAMRYTLRDVEIAEEGVAVVPAQLFAGILREIGDDLVTVSVTRQKLSMETDGGFFELECEDAGQYPEIPVFPETSAGTVAADDLRALVKKTSFAAGKEAARFVLNGVRIAVEGDRLSFVATDGRRLAMLDRGFEPAARGEGKPVEAIVGVRGLQHFERVAAGSEGPVEIALEDRFVSLKTADAQVTARVMDGTFPEVSQIIPAKVSSVAKIPVNALGARLRQVGQFASVESQAVILTFSPGELSISAAGQDGRADVKINIEYDGPSEKIGFNPAFLLDALKVVDGEKLSFGFSDRNAAAKLTDDGGFLYVIMPVLID